MAAQTKLDAGPAKVKTRYKVTNWAEYDRALVNRGNLTIWFDEASINTAACGAWQTGFVLGCGDTNLFDAQDTVQAALPRDRKLAQVVDAPVPV